MCFRTVISSLIVLLWLMLGCKTVQPRSHHYPRNTIEILYRLQTDWVAPGSKPGQDIGLVSAYRSFGELLYSECRNFPSDSTFLTLLHQQKNCDTSWSLPQAVSRLLREGDIARIPGYQPIPYQGRLRWVDFPTVCH